jgi:surface protein
MIETIFDLNGEKTIIESNKEEVIRNICEIFAKKISKSIDDFDFFYEENVIDYKLTLEEILNSSDKIKNKILIIVKHKNNSNINEEEFGSITLIYKKIQNEPKIKLFGKDFVKNNEKNCNIIFKGATYSLQEVFNVPNNYNIGDEIIIILSGINKITNIDYMFFHTEFFSSPDMHKWNTKNITSMSNVFYGLSTLTTLPDISNWDISNVTNISGFFYECSSLESLPDISKWNTETVIDMSYMFSD